MKIQETASEKRARKEIKQFYKCKQQSHRKANGKSTTKKQTPKKKSINPNGLESERYLRTLKYGDFLKTKYWAHVRDLVLKRDGYQCVICKSDTILQVHHDSYRHHYRELQHLEDLMSLCKKCHTDHHYAQP